MYIWRVDSSDGASQDETLRSSLVGYGIKRMTRLACSDSGDGDVGRQQVEGRGKRMAGESAGS